MAHGDDNEVILKTGLHLRCNVQYVSYAVRDLFRCTCLKDAKLFGFWANVKRFTDLKH